MARLPFIVPSSLKIWTSSAGSRLRSAISAKFLNASSSLSSQRRDLRKPMLCVREVRLRPRKACFQLRKLGTGVREVCFDYRKLSPKPWKLTSRARVGTEGEVRCCGGLKGGVGLQTIVEFVSGGGRKISLGEYVRMYEIFQLVLSGAGQMLEQTRSC